MKVGKHCKSVLIHHLMYARDWCTNVDGLLLGFLIDSIPRLRNEILKPTVERVKEYRLSSFHCLSTIKQRLVKYWKDRSVVSPQFVLSVVCGEPTKEPTKRDTFLYEHIFKVWKMCMRSLLHKTFAKLNEI